MAFFCLFFSIFMLSLLFCYICFTVMLQTYYNGIFFIFPFSVSEKVILPVWGMSPKIALSRVDFPAPFRPMSAVRLPQWICRLMCSNTTWSPKDTPISFILIQWKPHGFLILCINTISYLAAKAICMASKFSCMCSI